MKFVLDKISILCRNMNGVGKIIPKQIFSQFVRKKNWLEWPTKIQKIKVPICRYIMFAVSGKFINNKKVINFEFFL